MATGRISSTLQKRIDFYLKSTESGNEKKKDEIEGLQKRFVKITQSPVVRKFPHLQGKRSPIEKHSSHFAMPQNQSSPSSLNINLKQQDTPKQQTGSLADAIAGVKLSKVNAASMPKASIDPNMAVIQELTAKLAKTINGKEGAAGGGNPKTLSAIQQEIAQAKEEYRLEEPNRLKAEAKVDTQVAKAREAELAQGEMNKAKAEAAQFKVDLKLDEKGVPTTAPPLPPHSSLPPAQNMGLRPQDTAQLGTDTLADAIAIAAAKLSKVNVVSMPKASIDPGMAVLQELKAKLAKTINGKEDATGGGTHKTLSAIQQEIARAKEEYRLEEPNRLKAEAKVDVKVAKAREAELAQGKVNKAKAEAAQFKVDLKLDEKGVPTTAPPLPSF